MNVRTMPKREKRLTATTTGEVFEPMTDWVDSLEAQTALSLVVGLAGVSGGFQCRVGIQTATKDRDTVNPAAAFNDATLAAYLTTAGSKTFGRVDPNGSLDGNIDTAKYFRLGILYKLAAAGTGVGDVSLEASWR
jgi:hypothetical protein